MLRVFWAKCQPRIFSMRSARSKVRMIPSIRVTCSRDHDRPTHHVLSSQLVPQNPAAFRSNPSTWNRTPQGSSTIAGLTISSVSGFSGIVNLTATISPIIGNGPIPTLNPTKATVTSGGTTNSPLSFSTSGSTPRRGHTIFVLATSGTFSHSLSISLTGQ